MKRILIVEDDADIAALEQDFFTAAGMAAEITHNGDTGLDRARSGEFDLVIVDLMLPGLDGFEICRTLHRESTVPIMVVSARTEDRDKVRALGLGADDYVEKPFSPTELVARVQAHLRRAEATGGGAERREHFAVGPITIDALRRATIVDGRQVALTAIEYELLSLFVRNPGRLFSREELFQRVWGEVYSDLSTVTVHIRRLREKIERDPSHPRLIETVWGMGYRLSV